MGVLVAVVSHPYTSAAKPSHPDAFGYQALRPAMAAHPTFLEALVTRLSSADHALCTNALQLINSLMRDAITNSADNEWPKFIKKLQDLGVIRAVYGLMQGTALQDLAQPLLEVQALTKVLLRKWAAVTVDFTKPEHKRAIRVIYQASKNEKEQRTSDNSESYDPKTNTGAEKWKRLGFDTNTPASEFDEVGFLGMMDLSDFVRRSEDGFQKLILEQSAQPPEKRCPVARASIAITGILYDHFEIDKADLDDAKAYLALDQRSNIDKLFKPVLLQWSRLHCAGLQAFFRLWKSTGAEQEDFTKISDLVRILLEAVIGVATRTKEISSIEEEIQSYDLQRLRELQMEIFEMAYEDSWGEHLQQVRDELSSEALQFIKEQRIRCLLSGQWFPLSADDTKFEPVDDQAEKKWRFVRLSHNRRWLHYSDYESREPYDPILADLPDKSELYLLGSWQRLTLTVDLQTVSSVVSNISAVPQSPDSSTFNLPQQISQPQSRILINGHAPRTGAGSDQKHHRKTSSTTSARKEIPLLILYPPSQVLSSEWLDGLLLLLNQPPITRETKRLLELVSRWGLKIRLLNVRFEEGQEAVKAEDRLPSREGLDYDYYYDVFGAT
jgi:engulfment and cell motility protein 1